MKWLAAALALAVAIGARAEPIVIDHPPALREPVALAIAWQSDQAAWMQDAVTKAALGELLPAGSRVIIVTYDRDVTVALDGPIARLGPLVFRDAAAADAGNELASGVESALDLLAGATQLHRLLVVVGDGTDSELQAIPALDRLRRQATADHIDVIALVHGNGEQQIIDHLTSRVLHIDQAVAIRDQLVQAALLYAVGDLVRFAHVASRGHPAEPARAPIGWIVAISVAALVIVAALARRVVRRPVIS